MNVKNYATLILNALHQAHTHFCLLYCGGCSLLEFVFGKSKTTTRFSQSLLRSADEMSNTQVTALPPVHVLLLSWRWCVYVPQCYVGVT